MLCTIFSADSVVYTCVRRASTRYCVYYLPTSVPSVLPHRLRAYTDLCPEAVVVFQAVKSWAREHDLLGGREGCLSSYAFTLLVVFYLQVAHGLPSLQEGAPPVLWSGYNVGFAKGTNAARATPGATAAGFFKSAPDVHPYERVFLMMCTHIRECF